jgi:acyl-CoA thioesterase FadM
MKLVIAPHLSPSVHTGFIKGKGVGRIMRSQSISFPFPSSNFKYPDTFSVGAKTDVKRIGKDRFVQLYRIVSHKHECLVAEGEALIVTYDHLNHTKARIPLEVVEAICKTEASTTAEHVNCKIDV